MATRTEKCSWCRTKVRVPIETQSITCWGCGCVFVVPQKNSAYNHQSSYFQHAAAPLPTYQYNGYYHQLITPLTSNQYNYSYGQPLATPTTNHYNGSYQQPLQTYPQPPPQVSTRPGYYNGYYSQQQQIAPQVSSPQVYGKKRAVICGISYLGQKCSLKGSLNDARSMKKFLLNMGFPNASILVLTEEDLDISRIPTRRNIEIALRWLVEGCQSGDSLVFYYSGHASRAVDLSGDEMDGYDELLCPVDYKTAGKISDDEINSIIIGPLPRGAKLHAISDTCFSGTIVDLPFMCRMNWQGIVWEDHRVQYNSYKGTSGGLAISISACDDHQNSGDTTVFTGDAGGALTFSLIHAVDNEPNLTYGSLLNVMRNKIFKAQQQLGQPPQLPQLSSTEKFDVFSRRFTL